MKKSFAPTGSVIYCISPKIRKDQILGKQLILKAKLPKPFNAMPKTSACKGIASGDQGSFGKHFYQISGNKNIYTITYVQKSTRSSPRRYRL